MRYLKKKKLCRGFGVSLAGVGEVLTNILLTCAALMIVHSSSGGSPNGKCWDCTRADSAVFSCTGLSITLQQSL